MAATDPVGAGDVAASQRGPTGDPLPSWRAGASKQAIQEFVQRVTAQGSPDSVPPEERVAAFDNDGTLWSEKPMPIQLDFILRRLAAMADQDPELRTHQPWQAAYTRDYGWLGDVITKHYQGAIASCRCWPPGCWPPLPTSPWRSSKPRPTSSCALPSIPPWVAGIWPAATDGGAAGLSGGERVRQLHCLGWGRDFMRPISQEVYGVPRQRVIGSSTSLAYEPGEGGGRIVRRPEVDVLDDGPEKPVRIWSRVGRRPILAAGNSNGDLQMLQFAAQPGRPGWRLLVRHDDPEHEFDYTAGAEQALQLARSNGWTVVSINGDWATVF